MVIFDSAPGAGWVTNSDPPAGTCDELMESAKAFADAITDALKVPPKEIHLVFADVARAIERYQHFTALQRANPPGRRVWETIAHIAAIKEPVPPRKIEVQIDEIVECILDEELRRRTGSFLFEFPQMALWLAREVATSALKNRTRHGGGRPDGRLGRSLAARLVRIFQRHIGKPTATRDGQFHQFAKAIFTEACKPKRPPRDLFRHYILPALRGHTKPRARKALRPISAPPGATRIHQL